MKKRKRPERLCNALHWFALWAGPRGVISIIDSRASQNLRKVKAARPLRCCRY